MRTAASEHLSHAQVMSRLSATFSALIKEQIEVVRRFLESDQIDLESSEMGPIVDLAVRLVERSAEWLELTEVANLARELRETLTQLDQLRPTQRQEMVAHCNVALEAESKLAEQLRTDGFGALLAHAGTVGDAVDSLRNGMTRAKAQAMAASRGVIDEATPEVGPHENLLALTFEIKSALVHQNERIASMNETLDSTLRSLQSALSDWELHIKGSERRRMSGQGARGNDPPDGRTLCRASAAPGRGFRPSVPLPRDEPPSRDFNIRSSAAREIWTSTCSGNFSIRWIDLSTTCIRRCRAAPTAAGRRSSPSTRAAWALSPRSAPSCFP